LPARLVFQWEGARAVFSAPNWNDLARAHFAELAVSKKFGMDPDYQKYIAANDAGLFRAWTARCEGELVGYIGWWIMPHSHSRRLLLAQDDLYILDPAHRKGMNGYNLFKTSFAALKESGVNLVILHSKCHKDVGSLLRRLGMEPTDTIWRLSL
jgi:hypothetical protein